MSHISVYAKIYDINTRPSLQCIYTVFYTYKCNSKDENL